MRERAVNYLYSSVGPREGIIAGLDLAGGESLGPSSLGVTKWETVKA